jgi:hypothetical protein
MNESEAMCRAVEYALNHPYKTVILVANTVHRVQRQIEQILQDGVEGLVRGYGRSIVLPNGSQIFGIAASLGPDAVEGLDIHYAAILEEAKNATAYNVMKSIMLKAIVVTVVTEHETNRQPKDIAWLAECLEDSGLFEMANVTYTDDSLPSTDELEAMWDAVAEDYPDREDDDSIETGWGL